MTSAIEQISLSEAGPPRASSPAIASADLPDVQLPGQPVQIREAEQHDPGGQRAIHDVLERRLRGLLVVPLERGEDVGADREELDGEDDHQAVRRAREQEHAQRQRQQQREELAFLRTLHLARRYKTGPPPPRRAIRNSALEVDGERVHDDHAREDGHCAGRRGDEGSRAPARPAANAARVIPSASFRLSAGAFIASRSAHRTRSIPKTRIVSGRNRFRSWRLDIRSPHDPIGVVTRTMSIRL